MTVAELAEVMRKHRVIRIAITGDSVSSMELHPSAFDDRPAEVPSEAAPIGVEHGGEPTPEQMLEWSTGQPLPAAKQPEAP